MELAWTVANDCWLIVTEIMKLVDHIGMIRMITLSISTCSMVQSFHGFADAPSGFKSFLGSLIIQALLSHLLKKVKVN